MAKRPVRVKSVSLTVINDPSFYKYASVEEALAQNLILIADLILAAENARYEADEDLSESA